MIKQIITSSILAISMIAGTAFASAQQVKMVFPLSDANPQPVQSVAFQAGSATCQSDAEQGQIAINDSQGNTLAALDGKAPVTFQIEKSQTLKIGPTNGLLFSWIVLICKKRIMTYGYCIPQVTVTCNVR